MATGFDPYHRWLSIPPSEQPANHYRLLGVAAYEANVEVIQNAAEPSLVMCGRICDRRWAPTLLI